MKRLFEDLDDEQLRATLCGMVPAPRLLTQTVREAAACQDVRVLGIVHELGAFEFQPVLAHNQSSARETLFSDKEIPIVAALANVIEGMSEVEHLVDGEASSLSFLVGRGLTVDDEFRRLFAQVTGEFVEGFVRWRELKRAEENDDARSTMIAILVQEPHMRSTLQALMAAACAMDDAQTVRLILEHDRDVANTPLLGPVILGPKAPATLGGGATETCTYRLQPWVLAFEVGAVSVVAELEHERHGLVDRLGEEPVMMAGVRLGPDGATKGLFGMSFLLKNSLVQCRPDMVGHVIGRLRKGEDGQVLVLDQARRAEQLNELLELLVKSLGDERQEPWVRVFVDAGLHKVNVLTCMHNGIMEDDWAFLESIRADLDWSTDRWHPHPIAQELLGRQRGPFEDNVLRWIDWAQAAGQEGAMLAWQQEGGSLHGYRVAELVARVSMDRALLRLIEVGFDPRSRNGNGNTLLQVLEAETRGPAYSACAEGAARLDVTMDVVRSSLARIETDRALRDDAMWGRVRP